MLMKNLILGRPRNPVLFNKLRTFLVGKEQKEDLVKSELKEAYDELEMCVKNFDEAPGKFREYWAIRITAAEKKINVLLGAYKNNDPESYGKTKVQSKKKSEKNKMH